MNAPPPPIHEADSSLAAQIADEFIDERYSIADLSARHMLPVEQVEEAIREGCYSPSQHEMKVGEAERREEEKADARIDETKEEGLKVQTSIVDILIPLIPEAERTKIPEWIKTLAATTTPTTTKKGKKEKTT
jgi:hypothetical protein